MTLAITSWDTRDQTTNIQLIGADVGSIFGNSFFHSKNIFNPSTHWHLIDVKVHGIPHLSMEPVWKNDHLDCYQKNDAKLTLSFGLLPKKRCVYCGLLPTIWCVYCGFETMSKQCRYNVETISKLCHFLRLGWQLFFCFESLLTYTRWIYSVWIMFVHNLLNKQLETTIMDEIYTNLTWNSREF